MGDGSKHSSGLYICTDNFSLLDVIRLYHVLILKFNLDCNIQCYRPSAQAYRIYIKARSIPLSEPTVLLPYMHSSMLYKLHL
jgi:hypothetical protein